MIDRDALRHFYDEYHAILDDVRLDEWPSLFTEDCLYRVIPRENFEAGYAALFTVQWQAQLTDASRPC